MPAADSVAAEEWGYLDGDVLRPARSSKVCMTCQHFRYEVGRHCVTLLTCPIHQGLIPQGEVLVGSVSCATSCNDSRVGIGVTRRSFKGKCWYGNAGQCSSAQQLGSGPYRSHTSAGIVLSIGETLN